jgi:4-amino-4-deoxy-L-arabinose transferase-like glycosyltransferase
LILWLAGERPDGGLAVNHELSPPGQLAGPVTEAQLVALRSLEAIAIHQAAAGRAPHAARTAAQPPSAGSWRGRVPWQLVGILALQAALSLRLIWFSTAFQDEALYLWAGHLEWAHSLRGTPVQPFQTWFSGAPVLYPMLGAVADSVGGLAAARLLSLTFMLGVSCFLWGTARALVGNRAAFVAVAAFVALAGTAFLGAFATYDALALLLLTCATWIAVRASQHGPMLAAGACLLAGMLLGLACAVKYAVALFVPLTLIVAALAAYREATLPEGTSRKGWWRSLAALGCAGAGLTLTLGAGLALGGHAYWEGVLVTTLNRQSATSSPFSVLKLSYIWTGIIAIIGFLAIPFSRRERPADRWLLAILALAILMAPAEQARVDTTVSLHKHVVFGAWFAAMAAGYVLARLSAVDKTRAGWAVVVAIPLLAWALLDGIPQSAIMFKKWPDASPISAAMPGLIARHPGKYLTSSYLYQVLGYYERGRTGWSQWQGDLTYHVPGLSPGLASDRVAIESDYFSLVIIATQQSAVTPTDRSLIADMRQAGGYHIVANAGGFQAWAPVEGS